MRGPMRSATRQWRISKKRSYVYLKLLRGRRQNAFWNYQIKVASAPNTRLSETGNRGPTALHDSATLHDLRSVKKRLVESRGIIWLDDKISRGTLSFSHWHDRAFVTGVRVKRSRRRYPESSQYVAQ
jgi:hypothetical protein